MAVYVKPNGLLGMGYMAAIKRFRRMVVYPPMMRQIEHGLAGARARSGAEVGGRFAMSDRVGARTEKAAIGLLDRLHEAIER